MVSSWFQQQSYRNLPGIERRKHYETTTTGGSNNHDDDDDEVDDDDGKETYEPMCVYIPSRPKLK